MKALEQAVQSLSFFEELNKKLKTNKGLISVSGCLTSQKENLISAVTPEDKDILIIAENELKAREIFEDMKLYREDVMLYPARDLIFSGADVSGGLIGRRRLGVIKALIKQKKVTVVTGTGGCMDFLLPFDVFKENTIFVEPGEEISISDMAAKLARMGYERCAQVENFGQFSVRGDIIDVFDVTEENPYRIELWGDEIDSIRTFDIESQRSIENCERISIFPATEELGREEEGFFDKLTTNFTSYFPDNTVIYLDEPSRIAENAKVLGNEFDEAMAARLENGQASPDEAKRAVSPDAFFLQFLKKNVVALTMLESKTAGFRNNGNYSVMARSINSYNKQFPMLINDLKKWKKDGARVVLLSASHTRSERLAEDLRAEGLNAFFSEADKRELNPGEILVMTGNAARGFEYPLEKFVVITESDIFGAENKKRKKKSKYSGKNISALSQLKIGDYVVHESHGLGIYKGIEQIERNGAFKDYIKIEYAKGSCLYIQATQLERLQKYGSSEEHKSLRLQVLGGNEWKNTKARVRAAVKDIAEDLVRLYAVRSEGNGYSYGPDTVWQREFEELFPYEETEDQLKAIEDTKTDMESKKIMDRLICGDVGYGKTEVALRAAFKAVQESRQVALLVPTTILAHQHFMTFTERMKNFPVKIEVLSRFKTKEEQKKIVEDLKKGAVDIVIGTHRLLSKDISFKNLGLLIIDEEQRFGVTHKEKIKQLRQNIDVLTLTATPIPRTMHMSLIGIRDMSILEEPPLDRIPIQTYVMEYDDELVREAISRELARDGQVYFVSNRVEGMASLTNRLRDLVPEARIEFAHGKMKEQQLEDIIYRFINGEIDVLVCTTIIETGMDIPNVNTMIVRDADRFGLAQLYQLRGRIGRSNRTSYAFLMYRRDKMLNEDAQKRLHTIREYSGLGSGIKIAMRDLEIRGAGNLLGAQQSGHMDAVGYDLYCKMLSEAVAEAKGLPAEQDFETTVDLPADAYIPPEYVSSENQKMDLYKRIALISDKQEEDEIFDELVDRFGEPPKVVMNLLKVARLKADAHSIYISEIAAEGDHFRINFFEEAHIAIENLPELIAMFGGRLRFIVKKEPHFVYHTQNGVMKGEKLLDEMQVLMEAMKEKLKL